MRMDNQSGELGKGLKRGKKRILFTLLITAIFGCCLMVGKCNNVYAYTEEEKQQAKAWLSAHGYSPDSAGASQAYQDYLNGKFDEELGTDTNGDGIPASTSAESTNNDTQEQTTQVDTQKDATTEEQTTETNNSSQGKEKTASNQEDGNNGNDKKQQSATDTDVAQDVENEWQDGSEQSVQKDDDTEEQIENVDAENEKEEEEQSSGKMKDMAGEIVVIVVSAVVILLIVALLVYLKKIG